MNIQEQFAAILTKLESGFTALTGLLSSKTTAASDGTAAAGAATGAAAAPGPDQAKVTELQGLFTSLKGELKTATDAHAGNVTKLAEANTQITTLTGQLTAKDAEITDLKGKARTVADYCAAQGIDIGKVPAGSSSTADPKLAVLKQYQDLAATDSLKAGQFWEKNQKAIDEAMASL